MMITWKQSHIKDIPEITVFWKPSFAGALADLEKKKNVGKAEIKSFKTRLIATKNSKSAESYVHSKKGPMMATPPSYEEEENIWTVSILLQIDAIVIFYTPSSPIVS